MARIPSAQLEADHRYRLIDILLFIYKILDDDWSRIPHIKGKAENDLLKKSMSSCIRKKYFARIRTFDKDFSNIYDN